MKKNSIESQFGNAILNKPITHRVKINWFFSLKLKFRPAKTHTIIETSLLLKELEEVNEDENQVIELLKHGTNFRVFCQIVAAFAVNSWLHPIRKKAMAFLLERYTTPEILLPLVSTGYLQTDPERFFFIMALTKGKDFLKKKSNPGNTKEAVPS